MPKAETILFAPLNWGLGHASRIVPLIKNEIKAGNKVIFAADDSALAFLQQEFPQLLSVKFKGFKMRYWRKPFFNLGLFIQLPFFYFSILAERMRTKLLVKKYGITKIISDNRYGLRGKSTHNVLITHQLFIKVPRAFEWAEPVIHRITKRLVKSFNECWVPDYERNEQSLSGELSHGKELWQNVKYIGPLSRFQNYSPIANENEREAPDVLVLISGPEPARSLFEKQMEERFNGRGDNVLMLCGRPGKEQKQTYSDIKKVSHLQTDELYYLLKHSKKIVARSGYSTIMDLHVLGRTAELIPTPGQPEQEYLAEYRNLK